MSSALQTPAPPSARDRILRVAGQLFYRDGYRAIGVDRVIAEADVAKATFYKHFPSKEALILAWLDAAEAQMAALAPEGPGAGLSAYAGAMLTLAERPQCLGCAFQTSAAEFGEEGHPAHKAARAAKARVLETMAARAAAEGFAAPGDIAAQVFLLLEGVWAARRMFGAEAPFAAARAALQQLLAGAARRA